MNETTEIKDCPFCGSEAEAKYMFSAGPFKAIVICSKCKNATTIYPSQATAIVAWNTRVSNESREKPEPVAWMYKRDDEIAFKLDRPSDPVRSGWAEIPLYAEPIATVRKDRTVEDSELPPDHKKKVWCSECGTTIKESTLGECRGDGVCAACYAEKYLKIKNRVAAIVKWLEANQSDVFKRGIYDAMNIADKEDFTTDINDRQDAQRYRWLRNEYWFTAWSGNAAIYNVNQSANVEALDATIDSAMQGEAA